MQIRTNIHYQASISHYVYIIILLKAVVVFVSQKLLSW